MPTIPPPPGLTAEDFETIEAAVLETPRGRWFLAEFARRIREQESARLLEAVAKLDRFVRDLAERPPGERPLGEREPGPVPVLMDAAPARELAAPAGAADGEPSPLLARIEAFGRQRPRNAGNQSAPAQPSIVALASAPSPAGAGEAFAPLAALSLAERLRLFH